MKIYRFIAILILLLVTSGASAVTASAHGVQECTTLNSYLTLGSKDTAKNKAVAQLQNFMHAQGHLSSEPTGFYGKLTFAAVKKFQAANNIQTLGVVGPATRAKIKETSCATKETVTQSQPITISVTQPINNESNSASVAHALVASRPFTTETFSNWKGTWGMVSNTSSGGLLLKAASTTSGAEAIFPNSSEWSDYRYTANLIVSNGDISLFSRYVDADNYVSCSFAANNVSIIQRVNGVTKTLVSEIIPGAYPSMYYLKSTSVSMRVKGHTIGCTAVGNVDTVYYNTADAIPLKGGIGIQTWQSGIGAATLELRGLTVEKL